MLWSEGEPTLRTERKPALSSSCLDHHFNKIATKSHFLIMQKIIKLIKLSPSPGTQAKYQKVFEFVLKEIESITTFSATVTVH